MLNKFTCLLILFLATTANSYAATGIVKGKIKHFRVHDSKEFVNNWAPPCFGSPWKGSPPLAIVRNGTVIRFS